MKPFELLDSPLSGTNLIEAGAGTGKTYTLAGLFVRLILEKDLAVDEILVVTYTEAATEELRDRVRKKIRETLNAFTAGRSDDAFCVGLMEKVQDREAALRKLQEALHDFDQAPIFTIHGFCRRMLNENAFESGCFFDTELLPDISEIEQEIVHDFWRTQFYDAPVEFVDFARSRGYSPSYFAGLLRKHAQTDIKIIPDAEPAGLGALENFRKNAEMLSAAWPSMRNEVAEKLQDPSLDKRQYKNPDVLISEMDRWLRRRDFPLPGHLLKFSTEKIRKHTRKNGTTPVHEFFDLCQELANESFTLAREMEAQLLYLKREFFRYAGRELPLRKEKRNIQSFDDLLIRFRAALDHTGMDNKENGPVPDSGESTLAALVRRKYKAALIDEFQDTDPVQYAIFRSIFEQGDRILFLIGDPKQAIYSFRGADLFAYIRAAEHVNTRYTLTVNHRSDPALIEGINAVFSNRENPFLYKEIPFEAAISPKSGLESAPAGSEFMIDGRPDLPFHLWIMDGSLAGRPDEIIDKGVAHREITEAVANEILQLLELGRAGRATIGGRPMRESDIAVLVRKNREAELIRGALSNRHIPSVLFSLGNIFDSPEAADMERVLAGIAEPDREDLVRTAQVTDMLEANAKKMEALLSDDDQWDLILSRFREYRDIWVKHGFIRMFRSFMSQEQVRLRLLGRSEGERRLTNILHLSEILHQASSEGKLGPSGLVKWLSRQRDPDAPRLEEHQIRLESDSEAVRIVTVHKSKGLEYPIVFCPFSWGGSRIPKGEKTFAFHDPNDNWALNLAIDPETNPNRRWAEEELLAENLRLLYVSLTRAKHRCYFVWGKFKEAGTSAPAYLFHSRPDKIGDIGETAGEDVLSRMEKRFHALTDADLRGDIISVKENGRGSVLICDMPLGKEMSEILRSPEASPPVLESRRFQGLRDRYWQIASFSSLLSGSEMVTTIRNMADTPDHDRIGPSENAANAVAAGSGDPQENLFAFPGGAKAGILFHDILEHLDYSEKDPAVIAELVAGKLEAYGYGPEWKMPVCRMLADLLVMCMDREVPDLTLGGISKAERLNELEFYFPLKTVTPDSLKKVFARFGVSEDRTGIESSFPDRIGRLSFQPTRGFMKGYIDLVFRFGERFYLIDWKSNLLGTSWEDYTPQKLNAAMIEACYFLQYHIYTLALDSYLRTRIPDYDYDRHFGGVYYIFLRGINCERGPESGIFKDRPPEALIRALREILIG